MMITTRLFHLLSLVLLLLLSSATTTTAAVVEEQECTADGTCTSETVVETVAKSEVVVCSNNHKECDHWASLGECDANPNFMLHNCLKACNVCHLNKAQITKKIDKISSDKEKDVDLTETPYGVKQQAENDKQREIVQNMTDYMEEVVFQDPGHAKVKKDCKNRYVTTTEYLYVVRYTRLFELTHITQLYITPQHEPQKQTMCRLDARW
jgi:hypothetical protein